MAILALYLRFSRRIYVWYLEETLWDLSGTVADNIRYGPQLKGKKLTDDEAYKLLLLADLDSSFCKKIIVKQTQRIADVVCLLMNYLKPSIPWHKGSLN
ncbi:hypothetical protein NC653_015892 [Populus alba x Populus x berolinensis]|uniref:Uncharacterized protein n=1 Tax=Populus alba x Populus x berolinensis TaxID=444605 RepID=A0AAD6QLX1_9ROSI|nr:hypothetical protein NC653_015892 [Populus alba x Populus x berolinensis]